ncbi:hypothetical protein LCGC14_1342780 [marine sediment metagenome]|uniref:Uncharacterized protein n=1 Tax=marine sediment metagenome TaxID=412755 RepID=A0A0F9KZK3_9ZZZZ
MDAAKLMGFETPDDKKVPVSIRDWNAQKLALWRSRGLAEIATREALEILNRCKHRDGCPGVESDTEPCFAPAYKKDEDSVSEVLIEGCPDREQRMSALVILNAARQLAPADARKPAQPYFAPSREYYSEVMAALGVSQIENEMLRALLCEADIQVPEPNDGVDPPEPAQFAPPEETV